MRYVVFAIIALVLLSGSSPLPNGIPSEPTYVRNFCMGEARSIYFHTSRGETFFVSKSLPGAYFNAVPNVTWFTPDGSLHSAVGSWEIVCKPAVANP